MQLQQFHKQQECESKFGSKNKAIGDVFVLAGDLPEQKRPLLSVFVILIYICYLQSYDSKQAAVLYDF